MAGLAAVDTLQIVAAGYPSAMGRFDRTQDAKPSVRVNVGLKISAQIRATSTLTTRTRQGQNIGLVISAKVRRRLPIAAATLTATRAVIGVPVTPLASSFEYGTGVDAT